MAAAAEVAKTPVLDNKLLPGNASMIELAFCFGSAGADKYLKPIGAGRKAIPMAGRALLNAILLIMDIVGIVIALT